MWTALFARAHVSAAFYAADIFGRTLLFRKGTPEPERVDCNEVVREMIVLLRGEISRYGISVGGRLRADDGGVRGASFHLTLPAAITGR